MSTKYLYETFGGYYYKINGGKAKRISRDEFDCDYEIGKRTVRVGDKVRIGIKRRGVYDAKAEGTVKNVLTHKPVHTRGKKVRLTSGEVGRVICVYKN